MQTMTPLSMYSIASLQPIVQLVYLDHNSLLDNKSLAMSLLTSKGMSWHSSGPRSAHAWCFLEQS